MPFQNPNIVKPVFRAEKSENFWIKALQKIQDFETQDLVDEPFLNPNVVTLF